MDDKIIYVYKSALGCVWDDCNSVAQPIEHDFLYASMEYLLKQGYIESIKKIVSLKSIYLPSFLFKNRDTGDYVIHFYTDMNGIFLLISRVPLVDIETLELSGSYKYCFGLENIE